MSEQPPKPLSLEELAERIKPLLDGLPIGPSWELFTVSFYACRRPDGGETLVNQLFIANLDNLKVTI